MNRSQFEANAHLLMIRYPFGYNDAHWRITYHQEDDEYFIRWTNGVMDAGHREFACFFRNHKFYYH